MSKKTNSKESSSVSITQEEIDSCVTDLGRLTSTIAQGSKPLSAQERRRMPRSRKDGASIAREIAQLAQKYGVDGVVDVDGMLSAVTQAEQLAPLDKVATNFSVLVRDRAFASEAASWKSATTGYTMLKRMARDNPDLARDLVGVTSTLKRAKSASSVEAGTAAPEAPQAAPQAQPTK